LPNYRHLHEHASRSGVMHPTPSPTNASTTDATRHSSENHNPARQQVSAATSDSIIVLPDDEQTHARRVTRYFPHGLQHREACIANRLSRAEFWVVAGVSAHTTKAPGDYGSQHQDQPTSPRGKKRPRIPIAEGIAMREREIAASHVGCRIREEWNRRLCEVNCGCMWVFVWIEG
jgi:hypothetical protein